VDAALPQPLLRALRGADRAGRSAAPPRGARRVAANARVVRLGARTSRLGRRAQEEIRKEAQTMSLLNHPNLVSCYCSFVNGPVRSRAARPGSRARLTLFACAALQNLWVIMPFFSGGSVLNIMKFGYPQARQPPRCVSCACTAVVLPLRCRVWRSLSSRPSSTPC
jgi:serine/threonine protein kinase